MPSAELALRAFQTSSTIASIGFITLFVQALLATYRKRKSQAKVNGPVALSAVASGDEPSKPTTADGGSSELAKVDPEQAWERPLQDKIDALLPQARSPGVDDTTLEIARTAAVYLLAAESLLRLRQREAREPNPRTPARLSTTASMVVRDTTAATASLRELGPKDPPEPTPSGRAALAALVTIFAAVVGYVAATAADDIVFGDQHADLARFTLRGEPRPAGPLPYPLALAVSAAGCAIRLVLAGLSTVVRLGLRLVRPVVMYPANIAFNCLVSGSLSVELPLRVPIVAIMSMLAILAMIAWAFESTTKRELEDIFKDVDEQE